MDIGQEEEGRSVPPAGTIQEVTQEEAPLIHNFYLAWVDYTNVQELDNPKPSFVSHDEDYVGADESHDEIPTMQDVIGEVTTPIVEENVIDSSCTQATGTVDVSEPSVIPAIDITSGKTAEPPLVSEKSTDVAGDDDPKGDNMNVSHADDIVIEGVKIQSIEGLVRLGCDPGVANPGVANPGADIVECVVRPAVSQVVGDTLNDDIEEDIPEDDGQEKKSKNRKHKKFVDESYEARRKLIKEERAAKRARKAERKARRAAEKAVEAEATCTEVYEDAEEQVQPVKRPTVSNEWLPEHEQQGGNAEEEAQESDEEDVAGCCDK
ncbi:hypothetical protein LIER_14307 [Lithospermum erythrorhizon]|uniref:Uncharacterized protein n=1 Tax=Lithospermum erythrorhizon TaxID=34254 RepID=A0AAV3Q121_LITER